MLDEVLRLLDSQKVDFELKYGENPHQSGRFYGDFNAIFQQVGGGALSYSNLIDFDAAVKLLNEFSETTFLILKHANACGAASRPTGLEAWMGALASDPVSVYGGILATNAAVSGQLAVEIDKTRFVALIAPEFESGAIEILQKRSSRILLRHTGCSFPGYEFRTVLNGVIVQEVDLITESADDLEISTQRAPDNRELADMLFANKIAKHTRTSSVVLARNSQLLGSGISQTSRVDALREAISKAQGFGFDLQDAVMASEGFLPFIDCVQIAHNVGISAILQPGGSIRDRECIEFCDKNNMTMVLSHTRHFSF